MTKNNDQQTSCSDERNDVKETDEISMETLIIKIDGMHCGGCVTGVEKALIQVHGVQSAAVSLEAGEATVTYDPAYVSAADLVPAVVAAGYSARATVEPASTSNQDGHCDSGSSKRKGGCCCS
ncbi:heavy-metal-associated domain-containing protein [Pseudomonas arcuscaelestis]|uniref:heavy-metal-associated domain-containing protein n=1 Tax=Pseudomonas arcuscaelestis TaxID=2710591 RepID=UPI001F1FC480|nr:heavy metal-associated domain-containing protein [Pseudomonas arcuscaelestis]